MSMKYCTLIRNAPVLARGYFKNVPKDRKGRCSRLYRLWRNMRHRARNNPSYQHVSVCAEWEDYDTFRQWACAQLQEYPHARGEASIDRIDPDGNYCPSNCQFIPLIENIQKSRGAGSPQCR